MQDKLRKLILNLYKKTNKLDLLFKRMEWCAIGFTGHISIPDEEFAKQQGYKSLNRFEYWLVRPIIEIEKKRRQDIFENVIAEMLGEDDD